MTSTFTIHPTIETAYRAATDAAFSGGTLVCSCAARTIKVRVKGDIAHNHACGCTKCWKPEGSLFSVVAVVPTENVEILENGDKLAVVDNDALIRRQACTECGVHMFGPVERDHPFKGLAFIHPERFEEKGWAEPGFAAFVSSIIEAGFSPDGMSAVRAKLKDSGVEPYDCLSPTLMDYIATWTAKENGALKK